MMALSGSAWRNESNYTFVSNDSQLEGCTNRITNRFAEELKRGKVNEML